MKSHILIVGGGPAGFVTAQTAIRVFPEKSVSLIKEIGDSVIPCAIPYMMHTMPDPEENRMGNQALEKAGIKIIVGKVVAIDTKAWFITLDSGQNLSYERLVLATGTESMLPPIPGVNRIGVFTIQKSMSAMTSLRQAISKSRKVAIIGGGFIGAEFADELSKMPGLEIHLIEIMPKVLHAAFDDQFCAKAEKLLLNGGVKLHTNCRVASIDGEKHVESVTLEDNEKIPADIVIVSIGARPSTELAKKAGLRIAENGSIWVDDYMRSDNEKIFAVGDCALKRDFFTRRAVPVWLASTATAEARNAGTNLYGIRVLHQIQGTIAAFSTKIGGVTFASTGMSS